MQICSPRTTRLILPSSIENTINGILLSIHKDDAVESIIPSPSFNISIYVILSYFFACLFVNGSSEYTPSTLFFAIKMRSEEHTSELQSRGHLVCRLLLEKKKL